MRALLRFFFTTLAGWRIEDHRPKDLPRYIILVAPHTSNWDFVLGMCVRSIARMGDAKFLGKTALFRPPYGWLFRALGGYPVERGKHSNQVEAVIDLFRRGRIHKLAIAPEGTRSYQPDWKTGFHYIARGAGVPVLLGTFDYPTKRAIMSDVFTLTDDVQSDLERIKDWFRQYQGKFPEKGLRPVAR
jgi:1-acyl-sn-glycerol-3-phosphate acyltransferase